MLSSEWRSEEPGEPTVWKNVPERVELGRVAEVLCAALSSSGAAYMWAGQEVEPYLLVSNVATPRYNSESNIYVICFSCCLTSGMIGSIFDLFF